MSLFILAEKSNISVHASSLYQPRKIYPERVGIAGYESDSLSDIVCELILPDAPFKLNETTYS